MDYLSQTGLGVSHGLGGIGVGLRCTRLALSLVRRHGLSGCAAQPLATYVTHARNHDRQPVVLAVKPRKVAIEAGGAD